MEYLNRGLVAVKISNGVFLSWRLTGTDAPQTYFKIYRNGELIKTGTSTDATNYTDAQGSASGKYKIEAYAGEQLIDATPEVLPWPTQYKAIQLNRPPAGKTPPNVEHDGTSSGTAVNYPDGQDYTYTPNDCGVGDLDGDGEYEIVVKWDPSNSKDNSQTGITGNVYLDAYKLDGTQLWRIDLGRNIRAGAHYTQFLVYDFDGDGIAELVCRTAPGTIDGEGKEVIIGNDNPQTDNRNLNLATSGNNRTGFVLKGSEYLTLFDGKTGKELHSVPFSPARGAVSSWGDSYGNRVDRFLACVAYLDGVHPSAVMCRGYYAKSMLTAYDVKNKQLVQRWTYDSSSASPNIAGQGNHNLSVADVDGDGKDEIIYGSAAIDDNGTFLYSTGLGHGDAMHVSDLDPDRPGLEVWEVHEESSAFAKGFEMHDARTGEIIWYGAVSSDNGRGLAADIDPRYKGLEMWSTNRDAAGNSIGVFSCKGEMLSTSRPSVNFRIYWDGDLQDELLDGTTISKWNYTTSKTSNLLSLSGLSSCNGTKKTPNLSADILGDWREELILYETANPSVIRIYTTVTATTHRLYTPMHDAVYRLGVAWQNAGYNQPPHLGFYIGDGLENIPEPNIYTPIYGENSTDMAQEIARNKMPEVYVDADGIRIISPDDAIQAVDMYSFDGKLLFRDNQVNSSEFTSSVLPNNEMLIVKITTNQRVLSIKVAVRQLNN
ncbi:MAG: rhamnogalacturonan lyase [Bacteroidales bacterium]|nr:rhamnogalacturonan lyase [Bacteroidales bacterium]